RDAQVGDRAGNAGGQLRGDRADGQRAAAARDAPVAAGDAAGPEVGQGGRRQRRAAQVHVFVEFARHGEGADRGGGDGAPAIHVPPLADVDRPDGDGGRNALVGGAAEA